VGLTGLTGGYRSDRCATTQSGDFEVEDTRRDRKACVEAKQVCGHRNVTGSGTPEKSHTA
jgi:hypothetical protein